LSSKGNRRGVGLAMEASFLLLAGSPFRTLCCVGREVSWR
jgi:hypothetical protein